MANIYSGCVCVCGGGGGLLTSPITCGGYFNFKCFSFLLPTAWVSSITVAVGMSLGPLMGVFVNRFGCRVAIILGCLSCAGGLALGSLAPDVLVLTIAFSVPFGIGFSFVYIAAPVTVTQHFTRRRSVALGIVTAGQGLGTMILGPTLQALVNAFDWRNTFLIMAGVLVLASFTGCFHKVHSQAKKSSSSSSSTQDLDNSKKLCKDFSTWKNPRFLMLIVMSVIVNCYRITPYVHLVSSFVILQGSPSCTKTYPRNKHCWAQHVAIVWASD